MMGYKKLFSGMNSTERRSAYFDAQAAERDQWRSRNKTYHREVERLVKFLVPEGGEVLEVGAATGDLLASLRPARGVGIDVSSRMTERAKSKYPNLEWREGDIEHVRIEEKFSHVVMSDVVGFLDDIETAFRSLTHACGSRTRIVITHYNYVWEPLLLVAEALHLKAKQPLQNWMSRHDVKNFLELAGFEVIKQGRSTLLPFYIPVISYLLNTYVARLPIINHLCVIEYAVARLAPRERKEYTVSIVVPARNEKGNIERAIQETPDFGLSNEIIFIEGGSSDGTYEEIVRVAEVYAGKRNIRYAKQEGKGKGDAVRKGFGMAKGEVLMILDADLTVRPKELPKFYDALASGRGEYANGSRLVYPLEDEAMRFLNILGNKFFSIAFSWLLALRIKDTLCGTKVLFRKDYEAIARGRAYFGDFDPFGDFDLLFGAAKLNLKFVEIPIRYQARTYGSTNISRWKHGWLLLKMTIFAMRKIKFTR